MIPLFKPVYSGDLVKELKKTLKSGWWGLGPKTGEFERKFAEFIGTKYAVSVNSCTAALHLSLKVLDLKPGDEVITTPITFISTAFSISYNNLKPVFADVEEDTLNLDPRDIEKKITKKTKAIIPMHFGGHPCGMDAIMDTASKYDLEIVEDCAHAAGSDYKNQKAGSFGKFGCFSFHAVKNLSTGDGGMITTNDKKLYERLKRLRWLGIGASTFSRTNMDYYSWDYTINEIGFKYHSNDIASTIGLVQLRELEKNNEKRRDIFKRYNKSFKGLRWMKTPVCKANVKSACHNYVAKVENRDRLVSYLNQKGVSAGVHYKPLYKYPVYGNLKCNCPVADNIWKKLITLPLYPDMTGAEISMVVKSVKNFK